MMMFDLPEDVREVQQMVRRVANERVAPRAHDIDRSGEYPQDMFDLLRELGMFTLPFPAEHGGMGSQLAACVAVEELARVCYNTAYLLIVQWVPFGAILFGGDEAQKARFLPGLADGSLRSALAVTEPQSGSDVAGIRTRAVREGDAYRINGQKIWSTNSAVADFVLVAAKTGASDSTGEINFFIVEKGTKGFELGRKEDKLGARGVPSNALHFEDMLVPAANRIGPEGKGFKIVMEAFNQSRPIIGARGVGLAQGAMELARDFILQRQAFGQAVSDFQGVRWMIADMATGIEASRLLVYRAAALVDAGKTGTELAAAAAMAKRFATDTAMQVAQDAVQLFGAAGISSDVPINRYFRDAKVLQIIEGTNQIQRNIISNTMLGRPRIAGARSRK
jgi:alkylation response protein AidB-like acyl-CoA dehydrogenase